MTLIVLLSTFHTYVVIFLHHFHIQICLKDMLYVHVWSLSETRRATDKKFDNTRISTVSICFIFKQHDWPSKEQLYIFKSHVKHCAKIVHFLTIMLLKNSVYFVKKTLCYSVNWMITEWDGKVTEWHSSAVLSHFSYLSVTFQMTEWHSFILWKKYKCVTQNKQIKLQIYEQGGVYAIFKIYPNWFNISNIHVSILIRFFLSIVNSKFMKVHVLQV